ncbi:MAG TPA: anhydro-N-acetylmuramic acid kinase, partial [Bacteroidota bacterium]|nr:anhydro-N-acetylmuramic acid kinase [Bacteroidota bacterium]
MKTLERLFRKNKKTVVGLMSGTSADGIDAVVVEITGNGRQTTVREITSATYPFPRGFKNFLLQNSDPDTARLDDLARLNVLIAELFADAAGKIVQSAGKRLSEIDLIGSHGQTVQHLPVEKKIFGKKIRATLQLGDPSVIAKRTGVVTVGNFRTGDIAVGGTGAPLVPLFDFLMFRSKTKNRLVLNIGGIANFTVLPRNCSIEKVFAFDTGPGNMVIDALVQQLYHRNFDN